MAKAQEVVDVSNHSYLINTLPALYYIETLIGINKINEKSEITLSLMFQIL